MTKWRRARKKPVVIEFREVMPLVTVPTGTVGLQTVFDMGELVRTREGTLYGVAGQDFIIKDVEGEIYPINKKIFYKTYDIIEEEE